MASNLLIMMKVGIGFMSIITEEIGNKIHIYRKKRHMTLDELGAAIAKGKSTLSKYEKGTIIPDIETLYDIADALDVGVDQLLYISPKTASAPAPSGQKNFFSDLIRFYSYVYDGRNKSLIRCVFDVIGPLENTPNTSRVMMYMNFRDYAAYQDCENTYRGTMEHFDTITNFYFENVDTPMEKASAHVLASYLSAPTKWGLFHGISSRPFMPISSKMLFSRDILEENEDLKKQLLISREDIRLMKQYNMMTVT